MNSALLLIFIASCWILCGVARCDTLENPPALGRSEIRVPYFYDLFKGGKRTDVVFVDQQYTAVFYGKDFGPNDQLKLVEINKKCKYADPIGSLVSSVAGVSSNKEISEWLFKVTEAGSYDICYYHAAHEEWVEVSPRAGRPIPKEEERTSTLEPSPECPTLPSTIHQYPYELVEVTVHSSRKKDPRVLLTNLTSFVARVLCLPALEVATIQLRAIASSKEENTVTYAWYFTILCTKCDYIERINYLPYYFAEHRDEFYNRGMSQMIGRYNVPVDVGKEAQKQSSRFLLLLTSIFFLTAGGLFVFGVLKYKERREQFDGLDNGFGLLDGDMEDLFPPVLEGAAIAFDDGAKGSDNGGTNARVGFIEVEE